MSRSWLRGSSWWLIKPSNLNIDYSSVPQSRTKTRKDGWIMQYSFKFEQTHDAFAILFITLVANISSRGGGRIRLEHRTKDRGSNYYSTQKSLKCPWMTSSDWIASLVAFDGHACQPHLLFNQ